MNEEICKICEITKAKYNCPRCNLMFCSVECYKAQQHLECSEGFYRENIVEELALRKAETDAAESSKTMLEILQRVEEQTNAMQDEDSSEETDSVLQDADRDLDSDDEEQEVQLASRLMGIDLDDSAKVWDRLTDAEKEEFQRFLENGDIVKMLPEPNIWWTKLYKVDLVQAAEQQSQQEQNMIKNCPKIAKNIPNLSDLLKDAPSPTVRHNMANVLAAYTFVYRYFLGDVHESALETIDCLLGVCMNLKKSAIYDTDLMAVTSVVSECCNAQLPTDSKTLSVLKEDVQRLFSGPEGCSKKYRRFFLLSAFSDVRSLLTKAKRELKETDQKAKENCENVSTEKINLNAGDLKHVDGPLLRSCIKKIDFYLAYVRSSHFQQSD
ncbi:zinc finger HIT domain-containing protein 2 [Anopheles maculipalpis]|uniref:zinc finger HIT domain-containing protein 2 n=1 Tax=Anopheles maculipalpis TaxID=1496333 RepID=UPI002158CA61|nr:zinc finger HIT domain-containing protein 2 [Anopheles maculipalpis]